MFEQDRIRVTQKEDEEEERKRIKTGGGERRNRGTGDIEYSIIRSKIAERIFSPED